jgi:phospholipid/cholesterol/gamma-HCH transport system substrate-binding protein
MNKYRREVTLEIIVGLFMFTVLIALGIFTIVLGRENMLKKSYSYEFVFSEVSGLREGDNVFLRGLNVGHVKQMDLYGSYVRVYVSLDVPLTLREGYKIDVTSSSMLGGRYLKINEGPESALVLGGNITVLGNKPVDVLEELSLTVAGIQTMLTAVSEGKGTLGKLLNDETMYQNMVEVGEQLKGIVARVERGEGTLGKLLVSDELKMLEDAQATFENLRAVSQTLVDGEGTLGQMLSGDAQAYQDLEASMAAVRSIAERIDSGEGTLGKLVRDEKLYDETTAMLEDVRAAVDDIRESSPITSFGSVFFGAF